MDGPIPQNERKLGSLTPLTFQDVPSAATKDVDRAHVTFNTHHFGAPMSKPEFGSVGEGGRGGSARFLTHRQQLQQRVSGGGLIEF